MSRPRCARRARAIAQTYSGAANQATEAWVGRASSPPAEAGFARRSLICAGRASTQRGGARGKPGFPREASAPSARDALSAPLVSDRRPPVAAERLLPQPHSGWRLPALVLGAVDHPDGTL